MIKDIRYGGVTATPSDYESPDGDLASAINLVPEDGALRPVLTPQTAFTLPDGYTLAYIHQTSAYTHYIIRHDGLNSNNILTTYIYWIVQPNPGESIPPEAFTNDNLIISYAATIKTHQINAIGNTLLVLTSEGMQYILWKDNTYNTLGTAFPYLPISFGLRGRKNKTKSENLDASGLVNDRGNTGLYITPFKRALTPAGQDPDAPQIYTQDLYINFLTEKVMAILNPIMAEVTEDNSFTLPFLARYALRLYNGDYVMQSSPVLLVPQSIPQCVAAPPATTTTDQTYVDSLEVTVSTYSTRLDYQVLGDTTEIENWKDIIESVDIFVSPPIYTYNPAGKIDTVFRANFHETACGIPNVSCYGHSQEDWSLLYYWAWETYPSSTTQLQLAFPRKTEEEINELIVNESRFYRIASIPIAELSTDARAVVTIKDGTLSALASQKVLTDGLHQMDNHIFKDSFVYNSRLNCANLERRSRLTEIPPLALIPFVSDTELGRPIKLIHAHEGESHIYHTGEFTNTITAIACPFLFLPDNSVTSIAFVVEANDKSYHTHTNPHLTLNGVYTSFGWHGINTASPCEDDIPSSITTTPHSVLEPNKLYTSEVNNPFYFPLTSISTIGSGSILHMCAAVKAMSIAQYGRFPLYVFTTESVWTLEVATDGTFGAIPPPVTRDVCHNPASITQLDSSVLFVTDRGIMLLSGSNSICISETLDDEQLTTWNPGLTSLIPSVYPSAPFRTFVKDARMLYDYNHQRIIVYNPTISDGSLTYPYAYVYSLKSKQWGMMPSTITSTVNSYPDALAVCRDSVTESNTTTPINRVSNYSHDAQGADTATTSVIITRPLKLDMPDVHKTIDTVIQRGVFDISKWSRTSDADPTFRDPQPVRCILYGSNDLNRWFLVASSKNHRLQGFRGTPYKYFRLVLLCSLLPGEAVSGCSVQFTPRLTNRPR